VFRKSSATLLILAALQASVALQAQEIPAPAASMASSSSPVATQLLDLRSERAALLRGIELQEAEISRLRPLGDRAALRSAVAERNRLRGSLRAVNTTIRLLNSIAQAGGVQSPASSFEGAVESLREGVARSEMAFREAQQVLEQAKANGGAADIAAARRKLQAAALRVQVANQAVKQLEIRREQIVAVVESNQSGIPRGLAPEQLTSTTPSDGGGESAAAAQPPAVELMGLIAADVAPVETSVELPSAIPETSSAASQPTATSAAPVGEPSAPVESVEDPAVVVEEPAASVEEVVVADEPVAPVTEQAAPIESVEEPAVVVEEPVSSVEEVVAAAEPVTPLEEPAAPTESVEEPAVIVEEPVASAEEVVAAAEPVSPLEGPAAPTESVESPAVVGEEPAASVEEVIASAEPVAPVEEPAAPTESVEEPAVIVEEPVASAEEVVVAEQPIAPEEEPAASVEEPAVVVEEPAAAVEEAVVAEEAITPAEEFAERVEDPVAPVEADLDALIVDTLLEEGVEGDGESLEASTGESLPPTEEEIADGTPLPIVEEPASGTVTDTLAEASVDTAADGAVEPPADSTQSGMPSGDFGETTESEPDVAGSASQDVAIEGYAVLRWTIPVTRANGAPLAIAELRGYEIYVLSESTGERTVIAIDNPLSEQYRLEGLPPDTWHFAVAAIDTAGNASELSAVVSKTIADTSVASNP
jgi:hypothetical protein